MYNGTATYKSAANLYLDFRGSEHGNAAHAYTNEPKASKQDAYLDELLGGESFLEEFDAPLKVLSDDPLFGVLIDHVDLIASKSQLRPSTETVKACIKTVFNEVEADQRFTAMGQIAKEVMS